MSDVNLPGVYVPFPENDNDTDKLLSLKKNSGYGEVMAGNDTQGLKYGTVGTKANSFYKWREENFRYYGLIDNEAHYFHISKIVNHN